LAQKEDKNYAGKRLRGRKGNADDIGFNSELPEGKTKGKKRKRSGKKRPWGSRSFRRGRRREKDLKEEESANHVLSKDETRGRAGATRG